MVHSAESLRYISAPGLFSNFSDGSERQAHNVTK